VSLLPVSSSKSSVVDLSISTVARMLNGVSDAVIVVDACGDVAYWNAAAESEYGWSAGEMLGASVERITPHARRADERAIRDRLLGGECLHRYDATRTKRNGEEVVVSVTASRLFSTVDAASHVVLVEHDHAATRALKRQLLQARQRETIEQLGAGIAHVATDELKAIASLAAGMAGADMLADVVPADIDSSRARQKPTPQVVQQLMDITTRGRNDSEHVVLDDVIRELMPILRRACGARVLLSAELGAPSARVSLDSRIIAVMLVETVTTALAACADHAMLVLSTCLSRLSDDDPASSRLARPGNYLTITLRESTTGLSVERLTRAADPSFIPTRVEGQLGLGLGTVRHLVESAYGHLVIKSAPPSRAVIELRLPALFADGAERDAGGSTGRKSESSAARRLDGNETILLVEDDRMVRNIISRSLRQRGYDVVEAVNGADGLLVAQQLSRPIHLVVTDVVMPGVDGRQLFDQVRRWFPDLAVLFISGYTRGAISAQQIEQANTAFLAKPFQLDALGAEVRRLLDQRSGRSALETDS
jgi:PAS domain S-box-containing protein